MGLFFFWYFKIFFKGGETEANTEEENAFYTLLKCPQQPGLGQADIARENSSEDSHSDSRNPTTVVVICCLPQCIGGRLNQKWMCQDLNQHSDTGCKCPKPWVNPLRIRVYVLGRLLPVEEAKAS